MLHRNKVASDVHSATVANTQNRLVEFPTQLLKGKPTELGFAPDIIIGYTHTVSLLGNTAQQPPSIVAARPPAQPGLAGTDLA
jgi:hypothetical protein